MKIYYTPKAQEDLMCIKERVIETWANEELAVKVIKRITGAVKRLVAFPYIGKEVSSITGVNTEYRCLFCEQDYVFYRVEEERILIVRILNEKQDYIRILFGERKE